MKPADRGALRQKHQTPILSESQGALCLGEFRLLLLMQETIPHLERNTLGISSQRPAAAVSHRLVTCDRSGMPLIHTHFREK